MTDREIIDLLLAFKDRRPSPFSRAPTDTAIVLRDDVPEDRRAEVASWMREHGEFVWSGGSGGPRWQGGPSTAESVWYPVPIATLA